MCCDRQICIPGLRRQIPLDRFEELLAIEFDSPDFFLVGLSLRFDAGENLFTILSEVMDGLGEIHDAPFQASLCVFGNTEMCFNSQLVLPQPDQDEIDEGGPDSACDE